MRARTFGKLLCFPVIVSFFSSLNQVFSSPRFAPKEQVEEKKEVTNRFAIADEDDNVASAAELTFFQASFRNVAEG